jgi:hypothetical protein
LLVIRYERAARNSGTSPPFGRTPLLFASFTLVLGVLIGMILALAGRSRRGSGRTVGRPAPAGLNGRRGAPDADPAAGLQRRLHRLSCRARRRRRLGPHVAQGADTLIDHALNGFSSSKGLIPKKGGRLDLSDEEVVEAVEYLVERAAQ